MTEGFYRRLKRYRRHIKKFSRLGVKPEMTEPFRVKCPWCDAEPGTPCVDLAGNPYLEGQYHRAREGGFHD